MWCRGFAAPTAAATISALDVPAWHPCFHQLPACLHHIYVSQLQRIWHRLKHSPPSPIHNNPPTKATFHPPLVERIPICPGAKFQPCFARAERPVALCLPWEGPHLPPQGQKMLQIIEGADAEGFLLTPDRYSSGFELRLPDTLGDGGRKYYCFKTCCVASCFAIMRYWIFIRRSLLLWQRGDILYATAICI